MNGHGKARDLRRHGFCPTLLLAPQLAITIVFFYWPASQAVWQSFLLQDAFGLSTRVRLASRTTATLFAQPEYYRAMATTAVFSIAVAALSLSIALLLATQADKQPAAPAGLQDAADLALCGRARHRRRAVAVHVPAVARHAGARPMRLLGVDWNPLLDGSHAMMLVVLVGDLEADQLQFPVLPRRAAGDPAERDRGGGDRRGAADPALLDHHLPAAVADGVLPARRQHRLRLLRHLRHHRRHDRRRSFEATTTLVYKVYFDGRLGGDLGGSAAQSVILMVIVIALTAIQFRYIERKVQY